MARNRTNQQRRIAKGKPFITDGDLRRFGPNKPGSSRVRDLLAKSELTPGEIYFMRFVGVRTSKHWIIDDDYRRWTKAIFQQRCNLRQLWEEGAARMRSL